MRNFDLDALELGRDYVDSRDVIDLLDELDSATEDLREARDTARALFVEADQQCVKAVLMPTSGEWEEANSRRDTYRAEWQDACEALAYHEEQTEELRAFVEECGGYADDWRHGATLIPSDQFEDYARQFAEDIGATVDSARWPHNHVDWEAAAAELAQDYVTVSFRGTDYMVR